MQRLTRQLWPSLSLIAACVLFGSAMVVTKVTFEQVPVPQVALWRFAVASVSLLPFVLASRIRLKRQHLAAFLVTAFLAVPCTYLLQFAGLALTTATNTALIAGLAPTLVAVAAVVVEREALSAFGWSAVAVSTLGALLLVGGPSSAGNWLGNLLVLLSLFAMTAGILLNKRLMRDYPPLVATAYLFFFGTLMLAPISLVWSGPPTLHLPVGTLLSLVGQGVVFTALPYGLWNLGLNRVAASLAGIYSNVEPASGALFGVLILKETLGPLALAGGLLVIGAAVLISLAPPTVAAPVANSQTL